MSIHEHLFIKGEYPARSRILSDLEPETVGERPEGATHSIFEELWHLRGWQDVVLARSEDRYQTWMQGEWYPPRQAPQSLAEWEELVAAFLAGLERAAALAADPEEMSRELAEGVIVGQVFQGLLIHNAYHLGKIVALRQRLGAWTVVERS